MSAFSPIELKFVVRVDVLYAPFLRSDSQH